MSRSKLLFILFLVILNSRYFFWKTIKMQHDEILYDKVWIPTRAKYDIYTRKTSTYICCLRCIEFGQALLMPYESFVMLLKSRSHTHHPHMHYSYTGGSRKNMHSIWSTQKCFTPTLGENAKNMFDRFFTKQMLQVLVAISQ